MLHMIHKQDPILLFLSIVYFYYCIMMSVYQVTLCRHHISLYSFI